MDSSKRPPGAHSRMSFPAERQLTIGECIAIERYGTSEADDRPITVGELLLLIDRLEVCTTCGWSRPMHDQVRGGRRVINLCAHWTRSGAQGGTDH
jgi:hypothetical protein